MSRLYNTNIIYYVKNGPKKATKFNNIPDALFENIISNVGKDPKVKRSIPANLGRLDEYVVFYKKNSSIFFLSLDENPEFDGYFQSLLSRYIDTDDSFKNFKIRKSEYAYNNFLIPEEDMKLELVDITKEVNEETIQTIVQCLKLMEVNRSKAIKLTELGNWYIWIDELDIIYFQIDSCFQYANGECTEQLFAFRYYSKDSDNPFTPSASAWEQQKKRTRKRVFPTSPQSPTNETEIDTGFIRYFTEKQIAKEPGIPRIIARKFNSIALRLEKFVISLKYSSSQNDTRLLQIMYNFCLNCTKTRKSDTYSGMFTDRLSGCKVSVEENVIQLEYDINESTRIIKYILNQNPYLKVVDAQEYNQGSKSKEMTIDTFETSIYKKGKLFTLLEELKYYFLLKHGIKRLNENHCLIHELSIEYIPAAVLSDYLRYSYNQIQFLKDDMTTPSDGTDYGGIHRQYINMLGKAYFRPLRNPELNSLFDFGTSIDMDKDNRYPFFTQYCTDRTPIGKENVCRNIINLFRRILYDDDDTLVLGNVLPPRFIEAIEGVSVLEHLCTTRNIACNEFEKFTHEMCVEYNSLIFFLLIEYLKPAEHQLILANFIQKYINYVSATVPYDSSRPLEWNYISNRDEFDNDLRKVLTIMNALEYDDPEPTPTRIFEVGMNEIIRKKVDPILEFLFYMKKAMNEIEWESCEKWIFGEKFDRQQIADCIQLNRTHPIMWNRSNNLKRHILDENTSKEWIESFLMTVTGSSEITSSTKIYLQPISEPRIPVAHTCTSTIDIFRGQSENEYKINEEAAELYEKEFGKRPENYREIFIASINYMIKSSASQFTLA